MTILDIIATFAVVAVLMAPTIIIALRYPCGVTVEEFALLNVIYAVVCGAGATVVIMVADPPTARWVLWAGWATATAWAWIYTSRLRRKYGTSRAI